MPSTTYAGNSYTHTWNNWISTTNGTGASTMGSTWLNWCTETNATTYNMRPTWSTCSRVLSPELKAQMETQLEATRVLALKVAEQEAEAAERATLLLESILTAEQMASYRQSRFFELVGSSGRHWRLHHGTSGNVRQLVQGREVAALCAHPKLRDHGAEERGLVVSYLPTQDCLIGQVLHLRNDDEAYIATANVHWGELHPASLDVAA